LEFEFIWDGLEVRIIAHQKWSLDAVGVNSPEMGDKEKHLYIYIYIYEYDIYIHLYWLQRFFSHVAPKKEIVAETQKGGSLISGASC